MLPGGKVALFSIALTAGEKPCRNNWLNTNGFMRDAAAAAAVAVGAISMEGNTPGG